MAKGRRRIPWGRLVQPEHCATYDTEFEAECRRLRLAEPRQFVNSVALRFWAKRNADRYYVPEELLHAWGIYVEGDASRI